MKSLKNLLPHISNSSNSKFKSLAILSTRCALVLALLAQNAKAANYYWDVNGATTGSGGPSPNGTWENATWTTDSAGTSATINWAEDNFARFAAGTDATGSYTVTMNGNHSCVGMIQEDQAANATLTINGSGTLTIDPPIQGFITRGSCNLVITNVILAGSGGVSFSTSGGTGSGSLFLYGTNTYSGGTTLATSGGLNFNNSSSLGTGPVTWGAVNTVVLASPTGPPGPFTIGNNFTNNNGTTAGTMITAFSVPVTFSGIWTNKGNLTFSIGNATFPNTPMILSGPMSGSSSSITKSGTGSLTLTGANTYTGSTTLLNGTLSVTSFNKVSGGTASSALGAPTTIANGTISIGSTTLTPTLIYTGAGETSDRVINLAGTTGGAILQADGTGPLALTTTNAATGAGLKTLTLQGSNIDTNSIGKIVNSSSATSVVKAQPGKWVLTGANTYTGGTTVNDGTLRITGSAVGDLTINAGRGEIAGSLGGNLIINTGAGEIASSVAGNVTLNGGVLTNDTTTALAASATLTVSSSTTVALNYSGTNVINSLVIDGNVQSSGVWGPPGSLAPNQNPVLAGTGYLNVLGKPVISQQPISGSVFLGDTTSFAFSVGVDGDLATLTNQWKLNGVNIPGANSSTYAIPSPVAASSAGVYSCWVTNAFGWTNSANATLYVLGTNAYTQTIRSDSPLAYWRVDETNGPNAYDAIGGYVGLYNNIVQNQSGYSLTDTDPAIALPGPGAGRGFIQVTNSSPFVFSGIPVFSIEAWAYFTNLTGVQRIFSTLALTAGHGWAFGIAGANQLLFTTGTRQDAYQALSTPLVTGVWYHLVCTSDGGNYFFYLNGAPLGIVAGNGLGGNDSTALNSQRLMMGCNPLVYTNPAAGDPYAEQIRGRLDELAIYGSQLSDSQVTNHYLARYADAPSPVPAAVIVNPPTNYVSLSTTLEEHAAGVNLNYQWYKVSSGAISGATSSSLTLSPLQLADAGNYYVNVSNNNGSTNSPTNYVAVLPIPTNASQLHLTNGLVLHLPFDGDYGDVSGHGNHGTNVGATTFVNDGVIGGKAMHYSTTPGSSTNYVTLGVRPDLQFGTSTDFSVAYWVRQPANSTYTNLPFLANEPVGSITGWMFAPYATALTGGGWSEAIGSMTAPNQYTTFPDSGLINDANWHHLLHSAQRSANVTTYLDGKQVDSEAIVFVGNLTTTTPANLGQDSTGGYAVAADADLDDVGVWQRTLTQLEVSGLYLAGASNHVSFAASAIVPVALQIQQVAPGQWQISWSGSGGTLQAAPVVNGTYTNVTGAASPYPVSVSSSSQLFYRLKY